MGMIKDFEAKAVVDAPVPPTTVVERSQDMFL